MHILPLLRRLSCSTLTCLAFFSPCLATAMPAGSCGPHVPRECLALAIEAMGGRARIEAVKHIELTGMGHTLLMEQSYRQAPFLTSYLRFHEWLDFANARVRIEQTLTWPEAGGINPADISSTLVMTPQAGEYRTATHRLPLSEATRASLEERLQLDPVRLLLAADKASKLHYEAPESLHGTMHDVLSFAYQQQPLRLLLDPVTHLLDAIERTRSSDDYWYVWGDVRERVYFENWIMVEGISYPSTRIEERNGAVWRSSQTLAVSFNGAIPKSNFAAPFMRPATSPTSNRREVAFSDRGHVTLGPGVDLYQGQWNAALIRQDDGVVILEVPLSPHYTEGLLALARQRYPTLPVKAALSTSDSWPHVGGVREAVAEGVPVYALDLNLPLLQRVVAAPHSLHPDLLQRQPRAPIWRKVSGRQVIGEGTNRIELYPLRGADTGRQYMVYFPALKLLYASDTLVLKSKTHALYQPELMFEVTQAVAREHLEVQTVFAMHQGPTSWSQVIGLVRAAQQGPASKGSVN